MRTVQQWLHTTGSGLWRTKRILTDECRAAGASGSSRSQPYAPELHQAVRSRRDRSPDELQSSHHFESVKDFIGAANTGKSELGRDHRLHLSF